MPQEEFDYGDYDLEDEADLTLVVEPVDALPYPDVETNVDLNAPQALGFTGAGGRTPAEAIAQARAWSQSGHWCGVGMCLATVQQYYNIPALGVPTAAASYEMSAHKRNVASGADVPRGAPVYWTGGTKGAGHIAISIGGGLCLSTDWARAGRIDVARIDDITSHWGLDFKGYTWEVNGRQVWKPTAPKATVHLSNLKPGLRNNDVLQVKKALHAKGYKGFLVSSDKYGKGVQKAYAKFQTHLGYSGKSANGIPGKTSLQRLGFKVLP